MIATLVLRRQSAMFAIGSLASLLGLVLTSVIAARTMGPDSFSAYAAMVAVLGVLGAGVAGAMEQETARRVASRPRQDDGVEFSLLPVRPAAIAAVLAATIVIIPLGWQGAMFEHRQAIAATLIVAGIFGMHAGAIARGVLAGSGGRARLGLAVALTGLLPVIVGVGLTAAGMDAFVAFGIGVVVGAASPIAVTFPRVRRPTYARRAPEGASPRGQLGALVAGNLFLTANMVAIPAVLRVHVDDLSAQLVASLQIVVSLSRLSTLLVANTVSVVVAAVARDRGGHVVMRSTVAALAFGLLSVGGTAILAPVLLPVVFGSDYDVGVGQAALASLSVVFLNPGYILTGVAVARGRAGLIATAWAGGALLLAGVAIWQGPVEAGFVLCGIALSALVPTVTMTLGLRPNRRPGHRISH